MDMNPAELFEPGYYDPAMFPDVMDAEVLSATTPSYDAYEDEESLDPATPNAAFLQECTTLIEHWDEQTDYLLVPSALQILPPPDSRVRTRQETEAVQRRIVLLIPGDGTTDRSVVKVTLVVHAMERCHLPDSL